MNVVELGHWRSSATAIGITEGEWGALCRAACAETIKFYVELRRDLAIERAQGLPFHLPARQLAAQQFLPGRRDRKLYLKLTQELIRIGLIERIGEAGFSAAGRRTPAAYLFKAPSQSSSGNVVTLPLAGSRARGQEQQQET